MHSRPGGADWLALREAFLKAQTQGYLQRYRRRRCGRSEELAGWFAEAALPSLSMEQALSLYVAWGGNRRTEFKGNDLSHANGSAWATSGRWTSFPTQ